MEQALARDLQDRAVAERGDGVRAAGTIDDVRTPDDEHVAGQSASVLHDDNADHTAATAAAIHDTETVATPPWIQAFPKLRVAQIAPAVAAKQPAPEVTALAARGRPR